MMCYNLIVEQAFVGFFFDLCFVMLVRQQPMSREREKESAMAGRMWIERDP
jgi:hypothetical protein